MRRRDTGVHMPFERSPEAWRAMGAPAFMWDSAAAVETERAVSRCGYRLDGLDSPQCDRLSAKRLTGTERDRIAAAPRMHPLTDAPGSWRSDVTIADVLAGRIPEPMPRYEVDPCPRCGKVPVSPTTFCGAATSCRAFRSPLSPGT